MRIIGGQYKGFRFEPNSKIPARPTTDRAKESLVNILQSNFGIDNKKCLDLFSGTGNIAYELASQGANHVTAIDANFHAVEFIKQTFQQIGFEEFKIIKADIFKWIKQSVGMSFDLIFADPPYDNIALTQIPDLIFDHHLLANKGLLIVEHRTSLNFKHSRLKYQRDYGQSRFSFFE